MFWFLLLFSLCIDRDDFKRLTIYQVVVSAFQDGDPNLGYGVGHGPSAHKGDLQGIINGLDYIKRLNFNAILLSPIFDSTNSSVGPKEASSGYYATNYFRVDPKYGDEEKFHELVNKAHQLGLYVILDISIATHGGVNAPSPSGHQVFGQWNETSYPMSYPYFKEVVEYWIQEFEIDGWKIGQSQALYQNKVQYLGRISRDVYDISDKRRLEGKTWGILGYVVCKHWASVDEINANPSYYLGIDSAFDFPGRLELVSAIAQDEHGNKRAYAHYLDHIHSQPTVRGYYDLSIPNMFIGNSETYRFGNLVRNAYGEDVDNEKYWSRHKIAIAMLAFYRGPITLYYGEEYGEILDCWNGKLNNSGSSFTKKQVAISDGKISNFNENQKNLIHYTQKMMKLRNTFITKATSHYKNCFNDTYLNYIFNDKTQKGYLMVTSLNKEPATASFYAFHSKSVCLVDVFTGEVIYKNSSTYKIDIGPTEIRVFEEIIYSTEEAKQVVLPKNANAVSFGFSFFTDSENSIKKSNTPYIIVGCTCLGIFIIVATGVAIFIKVKKAKKLNNDNDPLLDQIYTD